MPVTTIQGSLPWWACWAVTAGWQWVMVTAVGNGLAGHRRHRHPQVLHQRCHPRLGDQRRDHLATRRPCGEPCNASGDHPLLVRDQTNQVPL